MGLGSMVGSGAPIQGHIVRGPYQCSWAGNTNFPETGNKNSFILARACWQEGEFTAQAAPDLAGFFGGCVIQHGWKELWQHRRAVVCALHSLAGQKCLNFG